MIDLVKPITDVTEGLLPSAPMLVEKIFGLDTAEKINVYVKPIFGANFGLLTYHGLSLFVENISLETKFRAALLTGVGGLLATASGALSEEAFTKLLVVQQAANVGLGIVSLYFGQYAFSVSAIATPILLLKTL